MSSMDHDWLHFIQLYPLLLPWHKIPFFNLKFLSNQFCCKKVVKGSITNEMRGEREQLKIVNAFFADLKLSIWNVMNNKSIVVWNVVLGFENIWNRKISSFARVEILKVIKMDIKLSTCIFLFLFTTQITPQQFQWQKFFFQFQAGNDNLSDKFSTSASSPL